MPVAGWPKEILVTLGTTVDFCWGYFIMINSVWYQSLVTGPNSGMWVIPPSLIARNCTGTPTKTWGRDSIWIFATPILSNSILVKSTIFVDKSMVNQYIWPISPEIGLIVKKFIEIWNSLQFDFWTVSNFKLTIYENNLVLNRILKNTSAFRVLISTKCMKFDHLDKKIWNPNCHHFINGIFEPLSTRCSRVITDFPPYPKFRKNLPSW